MQALAGLEGLFGLAGGAALQGGEQVGWRGVPFGLPMTRVGDPRSEEGLGCSHQAIQMSEVAIERSSITARQVLRNEDGHKRPHVNDQRGRPGRQAAFDVRHRRHGRCSGRCSRGHSTGRERAAMCVREGGERHGEIVAGGCYTVS